jgi:hypothetical protein
MFLSPPRVACVIISANLNLRPIVRGSAIEKGRPRNAILPFCELRFLCMHSAIRSNGGATYLRFSLLCKFRKSGAFCCFYSLQGGLGLSLKLPPAFGPMSISREFKNIRYPSFFFFWTSIFWPVVVAKLAKRHN